MKKTNITLALAIIGLSIASCSKSEKMSTTPTACYTCTTNMTILSPAHDSISVVNYCDKTSDDIQAIQNAGSYSNSYLYSYTICKKD